MVLVVAFLEYILWMVNIASPPSSPQPQCPPPHPYWTKFTLGLTCDDFTLSLGPLKAEIHAFSDGLSENDWKSQNERVHKFCSSALVFAGTAILFFLHGKIYRGHILNVFQTSSDTGNTLKTPWKSGFFQKKGRKRVKEWREVTFMKEWVKALDDTRILAPADLR